MSDGLIFWLFPAIGMATALLWRAVGRRVSPLRRARFAALLVALVGAVAYVSFLVDQGGDAERTQDWVATGYLAVMFALVFLLPAILPVLLLIGTPSPLRKVLAAIGAAGALIVTVTTMGVGLLMIGTAGEARPFIIGVVSYGAPLLALAVTEWIVIRSIWQARSLPG